MKNTLENKSILITGANGGIGIETVKILAKKGAKRIALACRTLESARETITSIGHTNSNLEPYGGFDMLDNEKIKEAVSLLPNKKFDVIFLQAGGMVVADSFQFIDVNGKRVERTVQQNAIGGLLTIMHLENAGLIDENARIVFAGGEGARGIPKMINKPDFKTKVELIDYLTNATGKYKALDAIGVSKYISALFTQKLAQSNPSRSYVWFSPGLTGGTKGLDALENPKKFIMKHIGFPMLQLLGLAQGPEKAAQKYVLALNSEIGSNGDLIGAPEGKTLGKLVDQKPMNPSLTNHQLIERSWDFVEELYPILHEKKETITL